MSCGIGADEHDGEVGAALAGALGPAAGSPPHTPAQPTVAACYAC